MRESGRDGDMTDLVRSAWTSPDPKLIRHVEDLSRKSLESYRVDSSLVEEHANLELDIAEGGYGRRQLFELVQNGADAMIGSAIGRIHVLLTERYLYCANEGNPIDARGLDAILERISR